MQNSPDTLASGAFSLAEQINGLPNRSVHRRLFFRLLFAGYAMARERPKASPYTREPRALPRQCIKKRSAKGNDTEHPPMVLR